MKRTNTVVSSIDTDNEEYEGKNSLKAKFIKLRAQGFSYKKISKILKVGISTLANWNNELENDIARLKAFELESLQEQYHILREGRIKLLGGILEKTNKELAKRNFEDLPTEKLIDVFIKLFQEIKGEYIEVKPVLKDKTGINMNKNDYLKEIHSLLFRFRSGEISVDTAEKELSILCSLIKTPELETEENVDEPNFSREFISKFVNAIASEPELREKYINSLIVKMGFHPNEINSQNLTVKN